MASLFDKFGIGCFRTISDMQADLAVIDGIIKNAILTHTITLRGHNYHSGGCEQTLSVWKSGDIVLVGDILSPSSSMIVEDILRQSCNSISYGGDWAYGIEVKADGSVRKYCDSKAFDTSEIETKFL